MSTPAIEDALASAFHDLVTALQEHVPVAAADLRPPVPFSIDAVEHPGSAELRALWTLTSGQAPTTLGAIGGLRLLGAADSEAERRKWTSLLTAGHGLEAVAHPSWDCSRSLDPEAVRAVYFAAGWIPVMAEPLEANYLAVDLVPLPRGHPGQVVLCGRDEDEKVVVAPTLASLFRVLTEECRRAAWLLRKSQSQGGSFLFIDREGGRLLTACRTLAFRASTHGADTNPMRLL